MFGKESGFRCIVNGLRPFILQNCLKLSIKILCNRNNSHKSTNNPTILTGAENIDTYSRFPAVTGEDRYTAKHAQIAKSLQTCCQQQVDIEMLPHGLRYLVGEKSAASFQQTCYKVTVKSCYVSCFVKL